MTDDPSQASGRRNRMPRLVRACIGAVILGALTIAVSSGLAVTSYAMTTIVTSSLIYFIAAVGLQIFSGNAGILSFSSAGFMAVGAYVGGILAIPPSVRESALPNLPQWLSDVHASPMVALMAAGAAALLVGLVLGLPITRLDGASAVIATIGILIIIQVVLVASPDFTRGSQTLYGVPRVASYEVVLAFAVLAVVVARVFRDTPSGLRLRASRDDKLAAAAVGVRPGRERLVAWLVSATLCGIAGGLLGQFLGAFTPSQFYFTLTMTIIAMVVVGGMGTVTGAMVGATLIAVMTEVLRDLESGAVIAGIAIPEVVGLTNAGLALVVLATMIIRSKGIVPDFELDEWLARLLERRRPRPPVPVDWSPIRVRTKGALEVTDVEKTFSGVKGLNGVSLQMQTGEVVGLIGANGSGKSTLVNVITGVTRMDSGSVRLNGVELAGMSSSQIVRRGLARTFQSMRLFAGLTARDNVEVAAVGAGKDSKLADHLTSGEDMMEVRERLATTLSYGDQRRVEIVRALATEPMFAFLDEPAAGMNIDESRDMAERIRSLASETGIGFLIVDHDMRMMAQLCDRIYVLDHGQVIAHGTPLEVLTDPRVAELYLGEIANEMVESLKDTGVTASAIREEEQ